MLANMLRDCVHYLHFTTSELQALHARSSYHVVCCMQQDLADVATVSGRQFMSQLCNVSVLSWIAGTGLGLAVALGASNTLETLTVNQYFHVLFRIALHLKVTLL